MSLDLILAGAAGGVVGATTVMASRAVSAAVTNLTKRTRATKAFTPTSERPGPPALSPDVVPLTEWDTTRSTLPDVGWPAEPNADATAHARLRERQLSDFADELAGDDPVLRERLRRFEGGFR